MTRLVKFGGGIGAVWLLTGMLTSAVWVQPASAQGSGSATLDAAKARGQVLCGLSGQVPGFSLPDSQGVMKGLDADSCRAVRRQRWATPQRRNSSRPRRRTASRRCNPAKSICCPAERPGHWAERATSDSSLPGLTTMTEPAFW